MIKYDDASWHYEGDFPAELPPKNGAIHIGMFLSWCIDNNLLAEKCIKEFEKEVNQVRDNLLTGTEFLIQVLDEKLIQDDLNETGNNFAKSYYLDDSHFAQTYASYLDDYADTFDEWAEQQDLQYESLYHVEDKPDNYAIIKSVIDQRYQQWLNQQPVQ